MTWETKQPKLEPVSSIWETKDGIRLSITASQDAGRWWQHFSMTFGVHTHKCHEGCLESWPAEAIRIARQKLDWFEQELNGEGL